MNSSLIDKIEITEFKYEFIEKSKIFWGFGIKVLRRC